MKFDPTKPVETIDGRPVRILATDAQSITPIVALIGARKERSETEVEFLVYADMNGVTYTTTPGNKVAYVKEYHLVNVKVKKWRWAFKAYCAEVTTYYYTEEEMKVIAKQKGYKILGRILETEIEE